MSVHKNFLLPIGLALAVIASFSLEQAEAAAADGADLKELIASGIVLRERNHREGPNASIEEGGSRLKLKNIARTCA